MDVDEALRRVSDPTDMPSVMESVLAAEVLQLRPIEAAAREVDDLARQGRIATFGGDDTGALYRLRETLEVRPQPPQR